MKRRIEKKLRQSLEVILPNESLSLPTIHSTFKWGYLFISILVISSILLLERPIVYFNQGIPVMMNTVKMISVEEQQNTYPWQESNNITYDYQQQEEYLQISYQRGNIVNVMLKKGDLTVESSIHSSKIDHYKVYLYQEKENYQATWQYQDFIVIVQSSGEKSHFINEIKHIMKENLK